MTPKEETKQETLEEAAFTAREEAFKEFRKGILEANRFDFVCGFTAGAKWQQERMYSEEVVNEMFDTLKRNAVNNVATITNIDLFISSWKRELKKK